MFFIMREVERNFMITATPATEVDNEDKSLPQLASSLKGIMTGVMKSLIILLFLALCLPKMSSEDEDPKKKYITYRRFLAQMILAKLKEAGHTFPLQRVSHFTILRAKRVYLCFFFTAT